jgi:hypothetical protein
MSKARSAAKIIYVPILKTKAGERWALSHLKSTTRLNVKPLLEIHPHRTKEDSTHVSELCEELQVAWGTSRFFYLDAIWLHGDSGNPSTLASVFASTTDCELRAIPVIRPSFNEASLEQAREIIEEMGHGYLLRVPPRTSESIIDFVVNAIGIERSSVDLMVDYRGHGMSLVVDEPFIPHLSEWRRLIAASGTFPRSLAALPLHTWHPVPRTCWQTYLAGVEQPLSRKPIYADYTIRDTGAPPDFGEPSVNLRYATDDVWQVQVGGKVKDGASGEIYNVCAELVSSPHFDGQDFSSGDSEIASVADPDPDDGPGNATQWLQWCVNHHIEKVVQQLSAA